MRLTSQRHELAIARRRALPAVVAVVLAIATMPLAGQGAVARVLAAAQPPPPAWVGPNNANLIPIQQVGQSGHAYLYAWGAATLNDGSVLIGDYWNYQIRHYAKDGTDLGLIVTNANQGIGPGQHQSPYGIGVDPTNNDIYFGDVDGFRDVDKYDVHGNFLFEFNGNPAFRYPSRVVVTPDRNVWVIDQYLNHIYEFDPNGNQLMMFGTTGTGNGQFKQLRGIAIQNSTGNIYVDDNYNGRVEVFDSSGNYLFQFGSKGTAVNQFGTTPDLRGMAIDQQNGWLYVSDAAPGFVFKFDLQGNFISRFGGYGNQNGKFVAGPREVTIDGDNNVWVGDLGAFRAQKFSPTGKWLLTVPNPAQPPPNGGFNGPMAITVDTNGNIFVDDRYNQRIQKFDSAGNFITAWGHRGAGNQGFNYPRGLAIDPTDNTVLVVDTDNNLIKRFSNDGATLLASYGGMGTAPGKFQNPHGADVGPDGRIYVADTQNARVQVLDRNGNFLYMFGSLGGGLGQFRFDQDIELDPVDSSIWVSDSQLGKIEHFTNSGTYLGSIGFFSNTATNGLQKAIDLEVDQYFVYVADADSNRIKVWRKDGVFVNAFGGNGTTQLGQYGWPYGLEFGPNGHLYEVETNTERVQELQVVWSDTAGPVVTVASPVNNSTLNLAPLTLSGVATDNTAVASVSLQLQDTNSGLWLQPDGTMGPSPALLPAAIDYPGTTSTNWTYTFNPAITSYSLAVSGIDGLGNPGSSTTRTFKVADTAAPTTVINSPAGGASVPFGPVTINGTSSDNVAVNTVKLTVQNQTTGQWLTAKGTWGTSAVNLSATLASPGAPVTTWSFGFNTALGSTYAVTAKATDEVPKTESPGAQVVFSARDTTPPTAGIATPADGAALPAGTFTVSGHATDNVGVSSVGVQVLDTDTSLWLQPDGSFGASPATLPATLVAPGSTSTSWSLQLTAPAGDYVLTAVAADAAGNNQNPAAQSSFTLS